MDILFIIGPQAVGKMTVGEEIEKRTGLKLLHNHMTIDLVLRYMTWDQGIDLILEIREKIMKNVAKYKSIPGMVITFIWDFDSKADWDYVKNAVDIFEGNNIYFAELNSDVETRLSRNVTENRLEKKWTKRNIEWSNNELVESMDRHRMISKENEVPYKNYIRIDNTKLSPAKTAEKIISYFNLKTI